MIVVLDTPNQILRGISHTLTVANISCIRWDIRNKSSFDMMATLHPKLTIVTDVAYRNYGEELLAAQKEYGGKLLIYGLDYDNVPAEERYFTPYPYFSNLVINTVVKDEESYKCDAAIICNDCTYADYPIIQQVIEKIDADKSITSFRIYGEYTVKTKYYVGNLNEYSYGYVYKNTSLLIDLHGDHALNPELHNNHSILASDYLNDVSVAQPWAAQEINNFAHLSNILYDIGLHEESKLVDAAEPRFLAEFPLSENILNA